MKVFGLEIGGSSAAAQQPLVVGGSPAVDLLPPEVRLAKRSRGIRRGVIVAAVLIALVAGAGSVASKALSLSAELELQAGEARTLELLQEQASFSELTSLQEEIVERTVARAVATSAEIDWRGVITEIRGMLPQGSTLTTIAVESAPPMEAYGQATAPLQGPRLATVTFTVQGGSAQGAPVLLDALAELDGYVDGHIPSRTEVEGLVESSFVLHLDTGALANRFPPLEETAPAAETTAPGADAGTGEEMQ